MLGLIQAEYSRAVEQAARETAVRYQRASVLSFLERAKAHPEASPEVVLAKISEDLLPLLEAGEVTPEWVASHFRRREEALSILEGWLKEPT